MAEEEAGSRKRRGSSEAVGAEDGVESDDARRTWPTHDVPKKSKTYPATKWLNQLGGEEPAAEVTTPETAWRRGDALTRAFPQLTKKPTAAAAPAISAEEAAQLEARFARAQRQRKMLVRTAMILVWGAVLATMGFVWYSLQ